MPFLEKFLSTGVRSTTSAETTRNLAPVVYNPRRAEQLNVGQRRILKMTTDNWTPCNRLISSNTIFVQLVKKFAGSKLSPFCVEHYHFAKSLPLCFVTSQLFHYTFYTGSFKDICYLYSSVLHHSRPPSLKPVTCSSGEVLVASVLKWRQRRRRRRRRPLKPLVGLLRRFDQSERRHSVWRQADSLTQKSHFLITVVHVHCE
jgi:hypothetical protein